MSQSHQVCEIMDVWFNTVTTHLVSHFISSDNLILGLIIKPFVQLSRAWSWTPSKTAASRRVTMSSLVSTLSGGARRRTVRPTGRTRRRRWDGCSQSRGWTSCRTSVFPWALKKCSHVVLVIRMFMFRIHPMLPRVSMWTSTSLIPTAMVWELSIRSEFRSSTLPAL